MTRGRATVVVVGAGLAGLRCADLLTDKVDLVVLEARDRVGGRCWSSHGWRDGQVAEHGGELIEDGQDHVLGVIGELGLRLESRAVGPRDVRLLLNGRVRDAGEVRGLGGAVEAVSAALETVGPVDYRRPSRALRELDDMTVEDWIDANIEGGAGSDLGALMALAVRVNLAFEPRELSAVSLIHMWLGLPEIDRASAGFRFGHGTTHDHDPAIDFADVARASALDVYHVAGGNDLIAQGLAARLPAGSLRLSSPATAVVRQADGRYAVSVQSAPLIRDVDHVVLTAPMPLLREMDLEGAGLSALRRRAIAELPMGTATKALVQLDVRASGHPGWAGVALCDDPSAAIWDSARGQAGDTGILTVFTSGGVFASDSGAHGPADAEARRRIERLLGRTAPGLPVTAGDAVWLDSWTDDPWTRGAYAGFAPGQYALFAGFLGLPEDGLHFAGEHTSLASPGYLDGAVASGERAAAQVLAALGHPGAGLSRT